MNKAKERGFFIQPIEKENNRELSEEADALTDSAQDK